MADQREAVEMADFVLHWDECNVAGCPRCFEDNRHTGYRLKPDPTMTASAPLARAVIALDEECRRLRAIVDEANQPDDPTECADCPTPRACAYHGCAGPDLQPPSEAFKKAWKRMEAKGYQYGHDALENVRFGWELAREEFDPPAQPAPSSPGVSDPSEADVDAIATRLMLTWAAHVEAREADEPDGDGGVAIAGMSFDEAVAMAREAIRLGARVPR